MTIFIISAPSGGGKGTLFNNFIKQNPNFPIEKIITTTTRNMRKGEINGIEYNFISKEEFKSKIEKGHFVEYANVHDNIYGVSYDSLNNLLKRGKNILCELDIQGMETIKQKLGNQYNIVTIFIKPKDINTIIKRIENRGTETEESIKIRLESAKLEMEKINEFDHIILNDDLEIATTELTTIIKNNI